jgi:hypothetical protein
VGARGADSGSGQLRVFVICALALAVAGCSRQPPPQPVFPCIDLTACVSRPVGAEPMRVAPTLGAAHRHRNHQPDADVRHPPAHHARVGLAARSRRPHQRPAKPRPPASRTGAPAEHAAARDGHGVEPHAATPPQAGTEAAKVQEQVGVAATLAERMTEIGAKPAVPAAKDPRNGRLVAVLMTRPSVKTISDLRGKNVAIDERYAASMGKVATAIEAAGAPDVQLIDGESTAINRLTSGEVAAAVVALVSPEAADAFPQLAGFKLFQVLLPAQ